MFKYFLTYLITNHVTNHRPITIAIKSANALSNDNADNSAVVIPNNDMPEF